MRTVADVCKQLDVNFVAVMPAPDYQPQGATAKAALTVPSMQRHMSDEGWQIMQGLEASGYSLCDASRPVKDIVQNLNPGTVLVQDKREWDSYRSNQNWLAQRQEHYQGIDYLQRRPDIFKLTILKDAHQRPGYHREAAVEIGCHSWVTYYHHDIVKTLAPYVRKHHLIRTYHSIDPELVPVYEGYNRKGALLSGAIGGVYPLRWSLLRHMQHLPGCEFQPHPGYHNCGTNTPGYLQKLSQYKVAICTTSSYGYSLRKLIEATACGCIVLTNLPIDDRLPYIDDNMVRLEADDIGAQVEEVVARLPDLYASYSPERQQHWAEVAKKYYSYKFLGGVLAADIEYARLSYLSLTE